MQLKCRQCEKALHPGDVDIRDLSATCRHCGWAFGKAASPFRQTGDGSSRTVEPAPPSRRPGLPRPPRVAIDIDDATGALELSFPARRHLTMELAALFALSGPLVTTLGFALFALRDGAPVFGALGFFGVLGGATMVAAGLAAVFRRARLRIGLRELEVVGPLTLARARHPIDALVQLYVDEPSERGGLPTTYALRAVTTDARHVTLLSGIRSPVFALFLEQELEHRMGIQDEEVPGEYRRPPAAEDAPPAR